MIKRALELLFALLMLPVVLVGVVVVLVLTSAELLIDGRRSR